MFRFPSIFSKISNWHRFLTKQEFPVEILLPYWRNIPLLAVQFSNKPAPKQQSNLLTKLFFLSVTTLIWGLFTWPLLAMTQDSIRVTGIVIDGVTMAPIAQVSVVSQEETVLTNQAGRFSGRVGEGEPR